MKKINFMPKVRLWYERRRILVFQREYVRADFLKSKSNNEVKFGQFYCIYQ